MTDTETHHIATTVSALKDEHATELRACLEVMRTEANVGLWRVAKNRFLELSNRKAAA